MDFVYFTFMIFLFWFIDATVRMRSAKAQGTREDSLRTIGGRDARPGEFPYVVRIELRDAVTRDTSDTRTGSRTYSHHCTGTVLSRTATLTAAHCCYMLQEPTLSLKPQYGSAHRLERTLVIRYGSATGAPSDDDRFSQVLDSNRPARFDRRPAMFDDVALLRTQPILLVEYGRVSALDYRAAFGRRISVLGYGITNSSDGSLNTTLKLGMPLQVVDAMWSRCDLKLQVSIEVSFPLACGVETCGSHAAVCPGDSGGPLLLAGSTRVLAVVSLGPLVNCQMRTDATRHSYIVYAVPLSAYVDWIADTMAANWGNLDADM